MYEQSLDKWKEKPWRQTRYKKKLLLQTPVDLAIFEELIEEVRPRAIIEAGVLEGGFSLWLRDRCKSHNLACSIIGIDARLPCWYHHYLDSGILGIERDTLDPETLICLYKLVKRSEPKIVILDDDHTPYHVVQELEAYSDLLSPGDYIVACDTIQVEGLLEAVSFWLSGRPDLSSMPLDKYGLSNHRAGWIKKV